jgi:hypothetical protein
MFALQQQRHDSEAATGRVEHLEEKVQQNLTRQHTAQMANLQGRASLAAGDWPFQG